MKGTVRRGGFVFAIAAVAMLAAGSCQLFAGLGDLSYGAGGQSAGNGSSAAMGGGGAGSSTTTGNGRCSSPKDCTPPTEECTVATCQGGVCGKAYASHGVPITTQQPGDCQQIVCDGLGHTTSIADDGDLPDDGTACTKDVCTNGVPSNTQLAVGTACNDHNGKVCDTAGECVECNTNAQCTSPSQCKSHRCLDPLCFDGTKDGTETGLDCGGGCLPCAAGLACAVDADCADGICDPTSKTCTAGTCSDGVQNQYEVDVDCGGPCKPCDIGGKCRGALYEDYDCASQLCVAGTCAPSCVDRAQDQGETDVDCGGTCSVKCRPGQGCATGADCQSPGTCAAGVCSCPVTCSSLGLTCGSALACGAVIDCNDANKNGAESAADCGGGGGCVRRCADGAACSTSADCASGNCAGGTCAAAPPCVVALSAGTYHACAVKWDGTLWCWGDNGYGQLGDGTTQTAISPVQVAGLGNVAQVSATVEDTCAVKTDGTLWCWGRNDHGQLGVGTKTDSVSPVQVTALGNAVAQVSANNDGGGFACAVKTDGTQWCWGRNDFSELGDGTTVERDVPVQVVGLTQVAEVAGNCARKTDGTVWCWGNGSNGELGNGTRTDSSVPVQVSNLAGVSALSGTCAVKTDGTAWCWGYNEYGELGDGTKSSRLEPEPLTILGNRVAEIMISDHGCALLSDASLWCWGDNTTAALGTGTMANVGVFPVAAAAVPQTVVRIALNYQYSCALMGDHTVWCWGNNDSGQIGIGLNSFGNVKKPTKVALACP